MGLIMRNEIIHRVGGEVSVRQSVLTNACDARFYEQLLDSVDLYLNVELFSRYLSFLQGGDDSKK